jgi:hypothetical protein
MVDRIDLLIAVIGIVAAIVGSSAPLWMALSKKADKEDLTRLEARMEAGFGALDSKFDAKFGALDSKFDARIDALASKFAGTLDAKVDGVEARLGASLTRVEGKLDALILRLVPEQLPPPGELGAGRG